MANKTLGIALLAAALAALVSAALAQQPQSPAQQQTVDPAQQTPSGDTARPDSNRAPSPTEPARDREAFESFDPSVEISTDNAVSFPTDI